MGRKSKAQVAEEKGIQDAISSLVNKINGIMEGYGEIKDVIHVVTELVKDEELMNLAKKIAGGDKDPQMFVLLASAILAGLKKEMEDNDGIFDYKPAE